MSNNPVKRGAGRPPGARNKATADIKALAREYVPEAMVELARLAANAESEPARVAAIKEIFDRAFGKASQALDVNTRHEFSEEMATWLNKRS